MKILYYYSDEYVFQAILFILSGKVCQTLNQRSLVALKIRKFEFSYFKTEN